MAEFDDHGDPMPVELAPTLGSSVVFEGAAYDDLGLLAAALQLHWAEALDTLLYRPDPILCYSLYTHLVAAGRHDAIALLGDVNQDPRSRLARFLVTLNPSLLPVLYGQDLRPGSIRSRLEARNSPDFVELLETDILPSGILTAWHALPGMTGAPETEYVLRSAHAYLWQSPVPFRMTDRRMGAAIRSAVYADALAPDTARFRDRLAMVDISKASKVWWWNDLARDASNALALSTTFHSCFLAQEQRLAYERRLEWEARSRAGSVELLEGEGIPFHDLYMRRTSKKGDWFTGR